MGGSINFGNVTPTTEWNIYADPEAASVVFKSNIKIFMAPLDLTHTTVLYPKDLERLKKIQSKFSDVVIQSMQHYLNAYNSFAKFDYAPLHDPVAVYYIINKSAFEVKHWNVVVETKSEFCDGRTIVDKY